MMKWITEQREETASWPKPNRPTDFAVWPPEDNMTGLDLKQAMGAFFYGGGGVGDLESPITNMGICFCSGDPVTSFAK